MFFIVWQMIFELGQHLKLCPHSNVIRQMIFFSKLYLFSCFPYCSAQDTNNFHDVGNIFLCRPIVKTNMLKHRLMNNVISMWFWIYCKKATVYIATVTGICVGSQGNVREMSGNFVLPTPWQPWSRIILPYHCFLVIVFKCMYCL